MEVEEERRLLERRYNFGEFEDGRSTRKQEGKY